MQMEIQQLYIDLTTTLAALVTLPMILRLVLVVDVLSLEEPTQSSFKKRPLTKDCALDKRHVCTRLKEEEELDPILRRLRHDEEMRQTWELEQVMSAGPSKQYTIAEQTTLQEEGGKTQLHNGT